jgi:ribosomal protein L1
MKVGKKYKVVAELVDVNKLYTIEEAAELVKKTST